VRAIASISFICGLAACTFRSFQIVVSETRSTVVRPVSSATSSLLQGHGGGRQHGHRDTSSPAAAVNPSASHAWASAFTRQPITQEMIGSGPPCAPSAVHSVSVYQRKTLLRDTGSWLGSQVKLPGLHCPAEKVPLKGEEAR
jgi:hypothetical protein